MNKNSLVKFDYNLLPKKYYDDYPFDADDIYVYLGDIKQMPGHCIVVDFKTGKIYCGYHTENFIELTEDEV